MSNLLQRDYYKLFTGTNQEEGYEKIHLGYEAAVSEISFLKDKTTYFHIPYFAAKQNLIDSTLIANGATPGPIPAMADRIMKKETGYGNNTPWGTSSLNQDGTWLCSWLYAVSSEPPKWLDRYYNPGYLNYEEALKGNVSFTNYVKSNLGFYDVPSTLTLEPEVYYQYFHTGELTTQKIVETFSGANNKKLRLSIPSWSQQPKDDSFYKNSFLNGNIPTANIITSNNALYNKQSVLSFEGTNYIECGLKYSENYNPINEFTISFWLYNKNWKNATSTQIIGNLYNTGYSIGYNNLKYNPYFVIPENTYGTFFYGNLEGNIYNNVIFSTENTTLSGFIGINLNSEVVVTDIKTKRIYKFDHLGNLLATCRDESENIINIDSGIPKLMTIDGSNNVHIVTTVGYYVFDQGLRRISQSNKLYDNRLCGEQMAFDYNGTLVREPSCYDVKFDAYNVKWTISPDQKVYYTENRAAKTTLFDSLSSLSATNLAIDPENHLWVLTNNGGVNRIDTLSKTITQSYTLGSTIEPTNFKNISFINQYNRFQDSLNWYALIYQNTEQTLYQLTLNGQVVKTTNLPTRFDAKNFGFENFERNKLQFTAIGDFTGYECRRIFNNKLYNSQPQIQFKIATKRDIRGVPPYSYTISASTNNFLNGSWHHVTCTYKNNTMTIYIDGVYADSKIIPSSYKIDYINKNSLYFGTPTGKVENLNRELNTKNIIWNGQLGSVKIYDYAIEPKFLQFLVREKTSFTDLIWNIPTTSLQYIEIIEQFYKHRIPGIKSPYFNILLYGTQITDTKTRQLIEQQIKAIIERNKPAHTDLLNIEWIN